MSPSKRFFYSSVWVILAWSVGFTLTFGVFKIKNLGYLQIRTEIQKLIYGNAFLGSQNNTYIYPEISVNKEILNLDQKPKNPNKKDVVSIGFVGDIIPGSNTSFNMFSDVIPYTEKPDIMIGNFEGVVANNQYTKCKEESSKCYAFNGDDKFLELVSLASFDVLNIANNHFNDHGQEGQQDTLRKIKELGIVTSGVKDEITYIIKNDLKIGFIGFSNYFWTNNLDNENKVKELVEEANANADIVMVIFHGGGEGEKSAKTPEGGEIYLGENRGNLRLFARNAIDAGADIVLGSGPHVLRGIEKYKNKIIAYSLGNFASSNKTSNYGSQKISAMLGITLNKNGSLVEGSVLPFEIDINGIPHLDLKNTAIGNINYLSATDFKGNGITLDPMGKFISQ